MCKIMANQKRCLFEAADADEWDFNGWQICAVSLQLQGHSVSDVNQGDSHIKIGM